VLVDRLDRLADEVGPAEILPAARAPYDAPSGHAVALRNGSQVNEVCFASACTPRAGAQWQVLVDVSAHPRARASLVLVSERALGGRATPFGELLIDVVSREPLFTSLVRTSGTSDVHALTIPVEWLGRTVSLQALILEQEGGALTNAVDLRVTGMRESAEPLFVR
jgi:hypothetical protein